MAPIADGGVIDATSSLTLDPSGPSGSCGTKCIPEFCRTRCGSYVLRPCNPITFCSEPCPVPPSEIERCDGRDNDCNGVIDDTGDALCDDGTACTADRCITATIGGLFRRTYCTNTPTDSACNDNNACTSDHCEPRAPGANAATGCTNVGGTASPEICDGLDNDCNGLVDDGMLCNDNAVCTLDSCGIVAGRTQCINMPRSFMCADTLACTVDSCSPGAAGSNPVTGCLNVSGPSGCLARGAETSPAFVADDIEPALVIGFNSAQGRSPFGWLRSVDGIAWSYCDGATPGCGGPGGAVVPLATGLLGTYNQTGWNGDPAVTAATDGSFVAYANLAQTNLHSPTQIDSVVVSFSFDRGQTFGFTLFANDKECGIGNAMDLPAITNDPLNPHRFWLVWRSQQISFGGKSGACVRGGDMDVAGGFFRWLPAPSGAPFVLPVETTAFYSVGGLQIIAFGDAVTVVYSNTDQGVLGCGRYGVSWLSITSFDGGVTWDQAATERIVFTSDHQHSCLPSATNIRVRPNMQDFDIAHGPAGEYWAVFPDDSEIGFRVFLSTNFGLEWTEEARLALPAGQLGFFPNIGVDPTGRVVVEAQAISADGTSVNNWVWFNRFGAARPTAWVRDIAPIAGPYSPGALAPPPGAFQLGDYNGLATFARGNFAGAPDATFFASWTDTDAALQYHIQGSLLTVRP